MEIKQYKDYDRNSVKIGDEIYQINPVNPYNEEIPIGKVISLRKEGFYVWVRTEKHSTSDIWGKFTRKVSK